MGKSKKVTEPVSAEMRDLIQRRLHGIAREENVMILFAVESGSRAWGFHSPDSDYDVRFVYARPVAWHLSLGKKRDVIERPIDDELDISGWELGKALKLAMGSNAVIAEWLQSPIIYHSHPDAISVLSGFARDVLNRKSVTWHYRALALRQQGRLAHPDGGIRLKRYFYILRPVLALRWMRLTDHAMPPMNMQALIAGCALQPAELAALDALIARKKDASEAAAAADSVPVLDDLVQSEMAATEAWLAARAGQKQAGTYWQRANEIHERFSREAGA